jgi:WS/DGAT/MGAT family acyltransferase
MVTRWLCHDEPVTDRLSPTDAAFLYAEDATTPMHVGGVVVLRPDGEFDYQRIIGLIADRLALVPRYRQKVRFVPGRLARPVWVDDEHFDLTYHVRRSSLPRPGTPEQLDELVGRLISRPLDRSRPLWELYIVEGLADGRVALVNKTHESMVDRAGAVDVAAAILDVTRRPRQTAQTPWMPAPAPSNVDLVVDAVADLAARPTEALDAARLVAVDLRSTLSGLLDAGMAMAEVARRALSTAARSALSVPVSGPRLFATAEADLDTVKRIRAAHGGTVNDVILAVITGATRSWLLSRGDPVSGGSGLRALAPMSVRPDTPGEPAGVASYLLDLPVGEPNPVMRLHQVSYAMQSHLESGRQLGANTLLSLGRFAPPTLHAMGARVAGQLSRRSYDMLITNVPGPQVPLYAAGLPVTAMYPVVPLVKGQAVAVGCTSYRGRVYFGLTADRDAMPDAGEFAVLLSEAVQELADAVPAGRNGSR